MKVTIDDGGLRVLLRSRSHLAKLTIHRQIAHITPAGMGEAHRFELGGAAG